VFSRPDLVPGVGTLGVELNDLTWENEVPRTGVRAGTATGKGPNPETLSSPSELQLWSGHLDSLRSIVGSCLHAPPPPGGTRTALTVHSFIHSLRSWSWFCWFWWWCLFNHLRKDWARLRIDGEVITPWRPNPGNMFNKEINKHLRGRALQGSFSTV
jgi:hypothetical protein